MAKPFEGLLGDSSELRLIQFMLPSKGLEFNISELARGAGVSRQTLVHIVKKLVKWNLLRISSKHGNANYYALNEDSGFVEAFESLNNRIIEQMLGAEELAKIAEYSIKQGDQGGSGHLLSYRSGGRAQGVPGESASAQNCLARLCTAVDIDEK
ncbi:MAG TPA: winged helix-turn-helix domain-containing protein [Methanothrix sp.]|jgi:hypothetical protein|nr:winged helix-turn-helix domain-containing protein [Methanothrix sp.]